MCVKRNTLGHYYCSSTHCCKCAACAAHRLVRLRWPALAVIAMAMLYLGCHLLRWYAAGWRVVAQ